MVHDKQEPSKNTEIECKGEEDKIFLLVIGSWVKPNLDSEGCDKNKSLSVTSSNICIALEISRLIGNPKRTK